MIGGFLAAPAAHAVGLGESLGFSPFWDWKTIETEHFRITFPGELAEVANRAANYYEEANATLSPVLLWKPRNKVQVVLIDNTDIANGLTTPVGRVGMILMVTPPENWFSTTYYDDWLRLLIFHEYTHFLNMDATFGLYESFRILLGDVILPNSAWPGWMLEGLAVYDETRYTRSGRGRSPYYEMVLRSAVESGTLDTDRFVTLDRINGPNPYYPGGETAYLFGYHLMNQVAAFKGQEALGEMSFRSAHRVPFFINGNLENITGKDWYAFWNEWVSDTRARASEQLRLIRSQPVTPVEKLTSGGFETLGSAVSPDGRWIAYTADTLDKRMGLYLRDLKTGVTERIDDKDMGAGVAFTPDSKRLLFSAFRRKGQYYTWSDLASYDLGSRSISWLTEDLRARDPDVSHDGKWVAFTYAETAKTGIAIAPLEGDRLGPIRKLGSPSLYDHVATPKFSTDGRKIYYSLHRNGSFSEDLMELDIESGQARTLLSDGKFNRYPAVSSGGDLYFISDRTGVDNLYRFVPGKPPEQVTNLLTGMWFPAFGPDPSSVYGGYFSYTGWDLAKFTLASAPFRSEELVIPRPRIPGEAPPPRLPKGVEGPELNPTPVPGPETLPKLEGTKYEVQDYSIWPSILPRQWAPWLGIGGDVLLIGGDIIGFDAVDRHRYALSVLYDSQSKAADWSAFYSNRMLGASIDFSAKYDYSNIFYSASSGRTRYNLDTDYTVRVSYPIPWTYSVLIPSAAFHLERLYLYGRGANDTRYSLDDATRHVPEADLALHFANPESSRLAISPEGGRSTELATRVYFDSSDDQIVWKGLFSDTEYLRLFDHSVLVPAVSGSIASKSAAFSAANVSVEGRRPRLSGGLDPDSLNHLSLRGYPLQTFFAKAAGVGSLEYRFPIGWVFRGWGTNPAFLEDIYGMAFAESAYFPTKIVRHAFLPSTGLGIHATFELLNAPVTAAVEFHQGLVEEAGGTGELFVELGLGALSF